MKLHIPKPFSLEHFKKRNHTLAVALFGFLSGSLTIGVLALAAHAAHTPLVFPSLGPTAFLLFTTPLDPPASPRNTVLGHLVGAGSGWVSVLVFGLSGTAGSGLADIGWARLGAASLSIGLTIGLMELWNIPHPPAGATTMIVSLGMMSSAWQIGVLMASVIALVLLGWSINRFVGVPYPKWQALPPTDISIPHG